MQLRNLLSVLIVLIIVASFGSLAYPSINVPFYSTETFVNTSTIANTNTYVNANTISTWLSYYATASYQVPVAGACWGGGGCFYLIWSTVTFQTSTEFTLTTSSTNQITVTSQLTSTNELTHTYSQNIPLYASLGMNDTDFVLIAILIIMMGGFAIFYLRRGFLGPQK
jgi:hypothetical protein